MTETLEQTERIVFLRRPEDQRLTEAAMLATGCTGTKTLESLSLRKSSHLDL